MPFPKGGSVVAVIVEYLCERGSRIWNLASIAVKVGGKRRDNSIAYPVVVSTRQQGGPGRRTHGGCVKGVVTDARLCQAIQRWRMNRPSKRARIGEAGIVRHNNHDIGRVIRKVFGCLPPLVFGVLQGLSGRTCRRWFGKGQHFLCRQLRRSA